MFVLSTTKLKRTWYLIWQLVDLNQKTYGTHINIYTHIYIICHVRVSFTGGSWTLYAQLNCWTQFMSLVLSESIFGWNLKSWQRITNSKLSDEVILTLPNRELVEFFEVGHSSYQTLNFLPYLTLSTQYAIFISLRITAFCFLEIQVKREAESGLAASEQKKSPR